MKKLILCFAVMAWVCMPAFANLDEDRCPPNDHCPNGIMVGVPSVTPGHTTGSHWDPNAPDCIETTVGAPGAWFTLIGTGKWITASTCGAANYDTKIHVYTGPCDTLECVTSNDDAPGCPGYTSEASWCSEEGVLYRILINGFLGATGNFTLTITEGEPCGCDEPDTATVFIAGELPVCQCLYVCADDPLTIFVTPLGPNEMPIDVRLYPGCLPQDPDRVGDGCFEECPPAYPMGLSAWTYDAETGGWYTSTYAYEDGCFCICIDEVLPVELSSFTATAGDGEVRLDWRTASEADNAYFDVDRDGTIVARLDAANSAAGSAYSWTDESVANGREYLYSLIAVSVTGTREVMASASATPSLNSAQVSDYALHQNYPNPFNPETTIAFDLAERATVQLTVYNAIGQTVATLANGTMEAGRHSVTFDATDLTSGIYFYRMETGDFTAIRKMILMK